MNVIYWHLVISFKMFQMNFSPYREIFVPSIGRYTFWKRYNVYCEEGVQKWNEWIINLSGKASYIILFAKSTQIDNVFELMS